MRYLIVLIALSGCIAPEHVIETITDPTVSKNISDTAGLIFGYPGKIIAGVGLSIVSIFYGIRKGK